MKTWVFRVPPRIPATTIMIVLVAAGTAGCTGGGSPGSTSMSALSDKALTSVRVAAIPTADLAGLYIAQNNGLFAQAGLHVTIEKIASSQAVITAQESGGVDIGAGSYIPYIAAEAGGAKFRILAEASTLGPDTRVLVTATDSAIDNVSQLAGKKIGVNGTNSIGTLLISELLTAHGISPAKVTFVTDQGGFPAMPANLAKGEYAAAFLAEPYVTVAGENYGESILADLDEGAASDFPIDGYVATQTWATAHPQVVAAFVRAVEEGQAIAESNRLATESALGKSDSLKSAVTSLMSLPRYPVGPVNEARIQREATSMLQYGMLTDQVAAEVDNGSLVRSMIRGG